ncbi:MAG: hypothetical protein ABI809_12860 [Caldimonas sp.]
MNGKYRRLRNELDAAYALPEWNSSRIDEIAEQIVRVELMLASAQHPNGHASPTRSAADGDYAPHS